MGESASRIKLGLLPWIGIASFYPAGIDPLDWGHNSEWQDRPCSDLPGSRYPLHVGID